jgi:anti-sigma regulatory factor (Ser/Thr protein kinase)
MSEITYALAETLAPHSGEDDTAILAARVHRDPSQRTAEIDLEPNIGSVAHARRFVSETLRGWSQEPELVSDAVLITSELVTNAIVHGEPPVRLRLLAVDQDITLEVDDGDSAMPRKVHGDPGAIDGRGLEIVAQLSSRWAARPNGRGKTVWSTLRSRSHEYAPN